MKITEDNFLQELQRKNEDALEFVVRNYGGLLKAVIQRILYDYPEDAEECLYDAILKIWEHSDTYNGKGAFESWAAAIAKYAALNRFKVLKRLEPMADIDELPIADNAGLTGNNLFDGFFIELISCLNEDDKALFIRIFWQGETIDEAAKRLGKPKSVLYNRISRGKHKIIKLNPGYFRKEENE